MIKELSKIGNIVEHNPTTKIQNITHYINEESLRTSHHLMNANKAKGIDKIGKLEYQENLNDNINNLLSRMRRQSYKPQPVRRTYIDKVGTKKKRPLGIPAYEDKLVQRVMTEILNTIFEPMFLPTSYGFRKDLNCHKAIKSLRNTIQLKKVNYVVDADIKGFFDNVDHQWILEFVKYRVADKRFIYLIERFLKAGVMEQGKFHTSPLDKKRPLGITAYEDKLVQYVMTENLNIIFEPLFLPTSYGFRPNLNCHKAVKALRNTIQTKRINYIVDADIKGFFDNVVTNGY